MTARVKCLAAIVACCVATIVAASTPQPDAIAIHVAVDGNPPTLAREDFEVVVDGAAVPIASFSPPPNALTIVLLVDRTMSMEFYTDMDEAIAKFFVPALAREDRVRIGGLARRLVLAPAFSSNPREAIAAGRRALSFRREERSGPSPLWDAVQQTLEILEPEKGVRAIIVVSDGHSTGNSVSVVNVADRAVFAGVIFDALTESLPLLIRQNETSVARVRAALPLEQIARATGGRIVPENPTPTTQLPPAGPVLAGFVEELRGMYTLGIAASGAPGSVHRVEVRMKRPGLTARARAAYRTR